MFSKYYCWNYDQLQLRIRCICRQTYSSIRLHYPFKVSTTYYLIYDLYSLNNRLNDPCLGGCEGPYSFRHVIALGNDSAVFDVSL